MEEHQKGKDQILAVAAVSLALSFVIQILYTIFFHAGFQDYLWMILYGGVFYFIYQGKEWGRIAMILLQAVGVLNNVLGIIRALGSIFSSALGILDILLKIISILIGGFVLFVLFASPTIKAYTKQDLH